jgi:hypothetical protein
MPDRRDVLAPIHGSNLAPKRLFVAVKSKVTSKMKSYLLGCAVLLCAATTAHAQTCHVPPFRALDNQAFNGYMTVKSGARCAVVRQNSSAAITSTRIISPPGYGTASVRGAHIVYASRRGYVGPDRFTFQGSGSGRYGAPVVRTVNVQVNVVP